MVLAIFQALIYCLVVLALLVARRSSMFSLLLYGSLG